MQSCTKRLKRQWTFAEKYSKIKTRPNRYPLHKPVLMAQKRSTIINACINKRDNVFFSEHRKISFLKKIQGVKEIINFENFDSSSSEEDPRVIELKKMPMRMRTVIKMPFNRNRIKSSVIVSKSPLPTTQLEEISESESVETFTSSSNSSTSSQKSVSPKNKNSKPRNSKYKSRRLRRSRSFVAGMNPK